MLTILWTMWLPIKSNSGLSDYVTLSCPGVKACVVPVMEEIYSVVLIIANHVTGSGSLFRVYHVGLTN